MNPRNEFIIKPTVPKIKLWKGCRAVKPLNDKSKDSQWAKARQLFLLEACQQVIA